MFDSLRPFIRSSVGRKQVMAAAGLLLCAFLVMHLSGNVLILWGKVYNRYAEGLETLRVLVLFAEAGLAACFVVHVAMAVLLTLGNLRARPKGYAVSAVSGEGATIASRTMVVTGPVILVFVALHLANFKFADYGNRDLYPHGIWQLVVSTLKEWPWAVWYLASFAALGLHLSHAIRSAFQTYGVNHTKYNALIAAVCQAAAWGIAGGYAFLALWCFFYPDPAVMPGGEGAP